MRHLCNISLTLVFLTLLSTKANSQKFESSDSVISEFYKKQLRPGLFRDIVIIPDTQLFSLNSKYHVKKIIRKKDYKKNILHRIHLKKLYKVRLVDIQLIAKNDTGIVYKINCETLLYGGRKLWYNQDVISFEVKYNNAGKNLESIKIWEGIQEETLYRRR